MKTHRYFRFAASIAALALAAACNNGTTSPSTSTAPALFSRQAKGDGGGRVDADRDVERELDFQDRHPWDWRPHGHQLLGGHGRRCTGMQRVVVGLTSRDTDGF